MRRYQETLEKLNHLSKDFKELSNVNYTSFDKEDAPHLLAIFEDTSIFFEETEEEYEAKTQAGRLEYIRYVQAFMALIQLKEEKIFDIYLDIIPKTDLWDNEWFWDDYHLLVEAFPQRAYQAFIDILRAFSGKVHFPENVAQGSWFTHLTCFMKKLFEQPEISEKQKENIEASLIEVMASTLQIDLEHISDDAVLENIVNINSFGIDALIDTNLLAKNYELIKKLFEADLVDESIVGDLEDIEIRLGMKEKRENPRKSMWIFNEDTLSAKISSPLATLSQQGKKKKKSKRKAQKKARRQNRKK